MQLSKSTAGRLSFVWSFILMFLLAGCSTNVTLGGSGSSATGTTDTSSSANSGTISSGVQGVHVFVEPNDGDRVITNAIAGAKKSVLLEMYLLTERKVISALEEAAQRGIDVRVMLEMHPYGSGSVSPRETLDRLQAAGVKAQGTNPAFALTHEKGMVIDGSVAYIMTANFTATALG
ncbi:MAG TPA: phospholipase D-like domain-containing protein, partial [Ktedonobacteraceae bacterium]|nr:phospholipase D-like domain-containing protein [Ktedonobacteraceae bacterium]